MRHRRLTCSIRHRHALLENDMSDWMENDMPDRRTTGLILDTSETDKPHRRLTFLLSLLGISTRIYLNIFIFIYFLLILE